MTLLSALGQLAALLGAASTSLVAWLVVVRGRTSPWIRRYRTRLTRDLAFVGGPSAQQILIGQACALSGTLAAAWGLRAAVLLALAVPILVGPHFALAHARAWRTRAIESQLDAWLTAISNTLVATASLGEALTSSSGLVRRPLRDEIERVTSWMRLGTPLDRALSSFAERVRSPVVSGAIVSLRIARNSGGDLRAMLDCAAAALRDMARFEGMVRAKTAEGKAQALAVSIVPAPLVLSIHAMSPEFFAPLGRSTAGLAVVVGAALLWIAAIALAAKVTAVDV